MYIETHISEIIFILVKITKTNIIGASRYPTKCFFISKIDAINIKGKKNEKSKACTGFVSRESFFTDAGIELVSAAGRESESHKKRNINATI